MAVAQDLSEKFDALFPAWPTVVATILAVLILLFVLSKFLYKPVKKMHDDRKRYIQNNISEAERLSKDAILDREKANDEIIQARIQATEIIAAARVDAENTRAQKILLANEEAHRLLVDAKRDIESQQAKFDQDSKEAIIDVALAAAAKVIEKEVDNKTNRKIIEDFISEKK